LLGQNKVSKADADQLLYSAGVIGSFKNKEVEGVNVFEQILPKEAKIAMPKDLLGDNTFAAEGGEMVREIDKQLGKKAALESIRKSFALGTNYLSRHGYTLSLQDLNVSHKVKEMTRDIINEAEKKTEQIIRDADAGTLVPIPGKSISESRELKIAQALNEVRSKAGAVAKANFPVESNISKMITSKAGGSILNITQIGCCVGQQILWNQRINFGYTDRTLSFFNKGNLGPEAHGFIKSSFFDGLKPTEFFFGAIAGRDSLMDTALRTPKSGYLYRRLVSALQDLRVEYDHTVRDASGNIVQFAFGGDGLDIAQMHVGGQVPAGEAVGVVTAQSFGEASTQMVLNVFHSAGVAEMQVTLGLPRLIEIFDALQKSGLYLLS
jgi:DNA-directed RNA polymerase subunit A'